ncbi:unnamed protein product, partial [Adineta steineri]
YFNNIVMFCWRRRNGQYELGA